MSGSYILPLLCFSSDLAENVQFLKLKSAHLCWAALPFFNVSSCYCATTLKTVLKFAFLSRYCIEKEIWWVRSVLLVTLVGWGLSSATWPRHRLLLGISVAQFFLHSMKITLNGLGNFIFFSWLSFFHVIKMSTIRSLTHGTRSHPDSSWQVGLLSLLPLFERYWIFYAPYLVFCRL